MAKWPFSNQINDVVDFVIIKATEGWGYRDPQFYDFKVQSTKLNKLIGCYHFARPDYHNTVEQMEKEADYFIKIINDEEMIGKSLLILDWETGPTDRGDLAKTWLDRVKEKTGITPMIYASASVIKTISSYIEDYPQWVAYWPSNEEIGIMNVEKKFKTTMANLPWFDFHIWQFSSKGTLSGLDSYIDLNYTPMSVSEWGKLCGKEKEKEKLSSDMKWAIDMGIIKGYVDGTYGPKDPLTREQAASLIHRLYDIIK